MFGGHEIRLFYRLTIALSSVACASFFTLSGCAERKADVDHGPGSMQTKSSPEKDHAEATSSPAAPSPSPVTPSDPKSDLDAARNELELRMADIQKREVLERKLKSLEDEKPEADQKNHKGNPMTTPERHEPGDGRRSSDPPMLASTKSLTNDLSESQIEAVVTSNIDKLVPCAKADSFLTIHASILPNGKVAEASSDASIPDEAELRDCVVKALGGVVFPKPSSGRSSPITFDLMLKPRTNG